MPTLTPRVNSRGCCAYGIVVIVVAGYCLATASLGLPIGPMLNLNHASMPTYAQYKTTAL